MSPSCRPGHGGARLAAEHKSAPHRWRRCPSFPMRSPAPDASVSRWDWRHWLQASPLPFDRHKLGREQFAVRRLAWQRLHIDEGSLQGGDGAWLETSVIDEHSDLEVV